MLSLQSGAVYMDQTPLYPAALQFQFMDALRQRGLAHASFPHQQDRFIRTGHDLLQPFYYVMEGGISGRDTATQHVGMLTRRRLEAALQCIVAGEIKINDVNRAVGCSLSLWWATLQQAGGDVTAFRQQKPADLGDMRACCQVDVIVLPILVKAVGFRKIIQISVNFLKIPWIFQFHVHQPNLGPG